MHYDLSFRVDVFKLRLRVFEVGIRRNESDVSLFLLIDYRFCLLVFCFVFFLTAALFCFICVSREFVLFHLTNIT